MLTSRHNNFDLIRLLAATQVVVGHSLNHLELRGSPAVEMLMRVLAFFPGVPIFFTVSGFLVYASFERSRADPGQYFLNRGLRIYPGLWACWFVTVALLFAFQVIVWSDFGRREMLAWVAAQLTIGQFYTPDLLRAWGVGAPNGSLWTIPVELQFYIAVPVIYFLFTRSGRRWPFAWLLLASTSAMVYVRLKQQSPDWMVAKLVGVCVVPYLYNFLFGVLLYKSMDRLSGVIVNRAIHWAVIYSGFCIALQSQFGEQHTDLMWSIVNIVQYALLSMLVLACAYSYPTLSERLLRGHDISYGVYIYHGLLVNSAVELGWREWAAAPGVVLVGTYAVALVSWLAVERPCLRLKSRFARAKPRIAPLSTPAA